MACILHAFNSDNSNIPNIKTQHLYIMTTITSGILKCKHLIKKPMFTYYTILLLLVRPIPLVKSIFNRTLVKPINQNQETNLHHTQRIFHKDKSTFFLSITL